MTGITIIGRIGEKKLADYAKMPLPALFHETTAAAKASKYMTDKMGAFDPMTLEHYEAALAKNKSLALNTLA